MPRRDLQAQVDDLAYSLQEMTQLVLVLSQQVRELKARDALRSGDMARSLALQTGLAMLFAPAEGEPN
jgi:hypothetical protein